MDKKSTFIRAFEANEFNASSQEYQYKTVRQRALTGQINQQSLALSDYYEALKVLITIPLIEKYQDDNLPEDSLYLRIIRDQKDLVGRIEKKVENPGFEKP